MIEELLNKILGIEKEKRNLISTFQALISAESDPDPDAQVSEILLDLAYDLDFYQPSEKLRSGEVYFGNDRLEEEIRTALKRIEQIRANLPARE